MNAIEELKAIDSSRLKLISSSYMLTLILDYWIIFRKWYGENWYR